MGAATKATRRPARTSSIKAPRTPKRPPPSASAAAKRWEAGYGLLLSAEWRIFVPEQTQVGRNPHLPAVVSYHEVEQAPWVLPREQDNPKGNEGHDADRDAVEPEEYAVGNADIEPTQEDFKEQRASRQRLRVGHVQGYRPCHNWGLSH